LNQSNNPKGANKLKMILFALLMAILVILLLTKSGQQSKEYAHSAAGKTYPLDYVVDCSWQMWHRLTRYSCESCPYSCRAWREARFQYQRASSVSQDKM